MGTATWVLMAVLMQPVLSLEKDGTLSRVQSVKSTMVVPNLTRDACDNAGMALDALGALNYFTVVWYCTPSTGVAKLDVLPRPKAPTK